MDGREDQIVLVEMRRAGWSLVASGGSSVSRSGSARARDSRRRSARAAQVGAAHASRPRGCARDAARTSGGRARDRQASRGLGAQTRRTTSTKPGQSPRPAAARWNAVEAHRRDRASLPSPRSPAPAVDGPMPGRSCSTRKPATRSRGFSAKRSTASTSLTCAASRNFRPPNFTNGMLRRVSSISSGPLWCEARNSTACAFSAVPASRSSRIVLADVVGLAASSRTVTSCGRSADCARSRGSW